MFKKNKYLFISLLSFALFLSSCGGGETSSTSVGDSTSINDTSEGGSGTTIENDHYDERNFVSSSNEVNKTVVKYYEGPTLLNSSSKVDVKVEDESLFVYETRVNHRRKFTFDYSLDYNPVATFDFEGKVKVDITVNDVDTISSAKVSPLVYGIEPVVEGNVISFYLEYHDNYVIEYNNDSQNVIHLFANDIEDDPITKEDAEKDDSILYIGPGVHNAGAIPVNSNQTIYIAGGAYVYGQFRAEGLENVTICGRGIISGEIYDRRTESEYTLPVEIRSSRNITIKDLTFLDPAGWCITLYKSKDITIENVKIMTARGNGDGISVQSCENVMVKKGFVRTWDDSLVVKNSDRGSTKNVTFDGVTVWTDLAQSMEVGFETYGPIMDEITFKNITVIHNFHKPLMSIHNADDANISNVKYENITLEDGQMLGDDREDGENDFFIDMTVAYSPDWTKSDGDRGTINGVTISDVKVYAIADSVVSRMNGESAKSNIDNVTIKNIDYASKKITSEADLGLLKNEYVGTVNISSDKDTKDILGAIITLPYKLNITDSQVEKIKVEAISQEGVFVPEFAKLKGDLPFIGTSADVVKYPKTSGHGAGNKATTTLDDTGAFEETGHSAELAFDGDKTTYYENPSWKNEADEFAALTVDFEGDKIEVGVIRIFGLDSEFVYNYNIAVFGKRIKNDGTINDKYVRILSMRSYDMSPANGNIIDLNITAQQYGGLQLRFFKGDSLTSPESYKVADIEFYSPSLTYNKAVVESTQYNDVYTVDRIVDGETGGTSYYEAKSLPTTVVIDLADIYTLQIIVLSLNPSLLWEARTQNIEISVSSDNRAYDSKISFTTVFEAQDYLFDPQTGNRVTLSIPNGGVQARYLKVVINSNTAVSASGGQLAEVSAYGIQ